MKSVAELLSSEPKTLDRKPVIQTCELRKVYRTGFWLNQKIPSEKLFTYRLSSGETFGLLGPNGAGKTTL